jgi:cell division protein FtsI/penicillin-binding protein 2
MRNSASVQTAPAQRTGAVIVFQEADMLAQGKSIKRVGAVCILLTLVFLLLSARIFVIQFFGFEKYQQKVLDQMTTQSPVRAARGEILDAAGRVLATNQTVYRVNLFPNVIAKAPDADRVATRIATGLSQRFPPTKISVPSPLTVRDVSESA